MGPPFAQTQPWKIEIPVEKLSIKFAKASGPGGQAVNKRSTKVEVRINLKTCDWIPDDVKRQIYTFDTAQVNQDGDWIITAQAHRSRDDNQRECMSKLRQFLKDAEAKSRGEPTKEEKFYSKVLRNRAKAQKRRKAKSLEGGAASATPTDSPSPSAPMPSDPPPNGASS